MVILPKYAHAEQSGLLHSRPNCQVVGTMVRVAGVYMVVCAFAKLYFIFKLLCRRRWGDCRDSSVLDILPTLAVAKVWHSTFVRKL